MRLRKTSPKPLNQRLKLKEETKYVHMHCTVADLAYAKDRDRVLAFENQSEMTVSSPIVDCSNL